MSELGDPEEYQRHVRAVFGALAATYDDLHFLQLCASRLTELAVLPAGARVLDMATGTGMVALGAAQIVGPTGRVVGLDLSPDMLARARHKLALTGLTNVEFREGDAQRLDLPDQSLDFVLCASSLFFVPDMLGALREWRRVLAPGGRVGFSSFGSTFLQPLRDLWEARLRRYGLTAAALPTHRLADPTICQQLLQEAGFTDVHVRTEQLGDYIRTADERWADIQAGPEGKPWLALDPDQREQARVDHLAELTALATPQGIWVDVPAIFAFAQQSGTP
jgi:ubiquinone/menaquinone biosynthesis C-methylase UbiE